MHQRIEITDQMLRTAWEALRERHGWWPPTFAQVMQTPLARGLVRVEALRRAQRALRPLKPATAPARRPLPHLRGAHLDRKRAAAGERDDD